MASTEIGVGLMICVYLVHPSELGSEWWHSAEEDWAMSKISI